MAPKELLTFFSHHHNTRRVIMPTLESISYECNVFFNKTDNKTEYETLPLKGGDSARCSNPEVWSKARVSEWLTPRDWSTGLTKQDVTGWKFGSHIMHL
jgi:hypothetical protein